MFRFFLIVAVATAYIPNISAGDLRFDVKGEGEIHLRGAGFARADIFLGALPAASHGRVTLTIENPLDKAFDYEGLVAGCNCVKTAVAKGTLGAGSALTLELTLDTPKAARSLSQDVVLSLGNKDTPANNVQIILRYTVSGLAAFKEPMVIAYAPAGSSPYRFRIPIELSADIDIKRLKLEPSLALREMTAKIIHVDDQYFADCTIPRSAIIAEETAGEIRLRQEGLNTSDDVTCIIRSRPAISISPSITRFTRVSETEYKATSIIRLNPESYPQSFERIAAASLGCSADTGSISIECKKIAPEIYRVFIVWNRKDVNESLLSELYWSVSAGPESANTKSHVFCRED